MVETLGAKSQQVASLNVVNVLRRRILDGHYAHGERIRQEDVAEDFQLSRLPVREALRVLETEGLVTIEPHKGARVAAVDRFELEQIYTLRAAVEPLAIRQSIPQITETTLGELEDLALLMETSNDVEVFLRADREFHLKSYSGVEYPLITDLVKRFWNTTQHYRRRFAEVRDSENFHAAHSDHRMLIQAMRDKNLEVASVIVKRHIEKTRDELKKMLDADEEQ